MRAPIVQFHPLVIFGRFRAIVGDAFAGAAAELIREGRIKQMCREDPDGRRVAEAVVHWRRRVARVLLLEAGNVKGRDGCWVYDNDLGPIAGYDWVGVFHGYCAAQYGAVIRTQSGGNEVAARYMRIGLVSAGHIVHQPPRSGGGLQPPGVHGELNFLLDVENVRRALTGQPLVPRPDWDYGG